MPPKVGILGFGSLCLDFYVMRKLRNCKLIIFIVVGWRKKFQSEMRNIQVDVFAPKAIKGLADAL